MHEARKIAMKILLVFMVVFVGCLPPLVKNKVLPPKTYSKQLKVDFALASIYYTWLAHHGPSDQKLAKRWVECGKDFRCSRSVDLRQIQAARIIVNPVVSVSVDVASSKDIAAILRSGFQLWNPIGEPGRVTLFIQNGARRVSRDVVRVYIRKLWLAKLAKLAALPEVIAINYAPIRQMNAYSPPRKH